MAFVVVVIFVACFHPLHAYQTDAGDIVFAERGKIRRELTLPCGQCIGCRLERSRQWAVRCMHESQMHDNNSFVTLTYDDDHIPMDFSLNYRHFQLFMKRLRRKYGNVRFYMCGEYGDRTLRPHFHACLFGVRFEDCYPWRKSSSGFHLYRSPVLEALWSYGSVEVGDVTFESAAYVARYCIKKVTGPRADEHYEAVDGCTGEIYAREPEFTRMSLKPGIGATWYEKYKSEVFPLDRVVVRGVEAKPPRYYKLLLDSADDYMSDEVEAARELKAREVMSENTPDRLAVRERICKVRVSKLKRSAVE